MERCNTLDLLRALITFIKESNQTEFAKSDFRNPPTNINPDTAEKLFDIIKFVQDQMPPIDTVIEIKKKKYFKPK